MSETQDPFFFDVHHHRCRPESLSVEEVTRAALTTWNRELLFHLSSPREGWTSRTPHYPHDYINLSGNSPAVKPGMRANPATSQALDKQRLKLQDKSSPLGVNPGISRIKEFPDCWRDLDITVEVEAKAKELAVKKMLKALNNKRGQMDIDYIVKEKNKNGN